MEGKEYSHAAVQVVEVDGLAHRAQRVTSRSHVRRHAQDQEEALGTYELSR